MEEGKAKCTVEVKVVNPMALSLGLLPKYSTAGAAGMDLCACLDNEQATIAAGETLLVNSGIAINIRDPNLMGVLAPRSGLGILHRLVLANQVGIIDSDYQGEIKLAMWNAGDKAYTISRGDRICQLLFVPVRQISLEMVVEFGESTARGGGGLGHTGKQ